MIFQSYTPTFILEPNVKGLELAFGLKNGLRKLFPENKKIPLDNP